MAPDRVDVEQVLQGIRDEIRRRQPETDLPGWSRPDRPSLEAGGDAAEIEAPPPPLVFSPHLRHLNEHWQLDPHFSIASHRPVIGPVLVAGKRTVRRVVLWLVLPVFEQITSFFSNVTNMLNAVARDLELVADRSTRNAERIAARLSETDERHLRAEREMIERIERAERLLVERMDLLYGRLDREGIALERRVETLEGADGDEA